MIIPVYNRAGFLRRALQSVLHQTQPPYEIIVVDDGSTDNTAAVAQEEFEEVRYIYQTNRGVSAARNRGIQEARGDWVALLDSDDEWKPEKLTKQANALKANAENKVCHTNEIWIKNGKRLKQKKKHRKTGGCIYRRCLPMCRISPSSVMIHQSVFKQVGLFDESLPACEDYDMWLRICSRYPVLFVDEPLTIKHGGHGDQLSQKYWGMDRFRIYALEKIVNASHLDEQQQVWTAQELVKKLNIYKTGAKKRGKAQEVSMLNSKISYYNKLMD